MRGRTQGEVPLIQIYYVRYLDRSVIRGFLPTLLFADYDIPTPRSWRVTGTSTGFQNNAVAGAAADALMQNFMQINGIRQAQLSVGKGGKVLMEKGYS